MASPTPSDYIIDFGDEEEGGGRVKVKDGMYKVRVLSAQTVKSSGKGTPGLAVTFGFAEGTLAKQKKKITETLWLTPKAYKRIRLLMEALDLDVPKSKLNVAKLVPQLKGGKLYIEIVTEKDKGEEYPDKSVVAFEGFINPDDYDPEAELDEEDLDEDADDAEDEDDAEDGDDGEAEDDDEEDADDSDDDEEDEPEPAPKKKKKAAAKKSAAKKSKAVDEDDEDLDLDDF